MAYSAEIDIRDAATARIDAYGANLRPESVNKLFARAGQNFVREHFFSLNRTRANALGGKRTNFYNKAARGTTAKSDAQGAQISVNQVGIRQRIEGGTILPKNGKYLTIPARAEAYGRRAREFNNLKVLFGAGGRPVALVVADPTLILKTKKGFKDAGDVGGGVMFWLATKAVQKPDPEVMPRLDLMRVHLLEELTKALIARQQVRGGLA